MIPSDLRSRFQRSFRLTWLVLLVAAGVARAVAAGPGDALGPVAMDSYTQNIVIRLKSAEDARRVRLTIAPLYHDLRAAVSTRMDDCNLNDLAVARLMAPHGQHGTFYLNDPDHWWQDSDETGIKVTGDRGSIVPPQLLAGGNSIGGHTLSHEFLPALSANAAFHEIMGVRVALETRAASPVVSFVYPFVYFQRRARAGRDRADIEETLRRAGYYQLAEDRYNRTRDSGLQDGVFLVQDGSTDGFMSRAALDTAWCEATRPLFLITMHPWVNAWGGGQLPKLAALYREWSGRADLWLCNQNQYAAYRYQASHSRLDSWVVGNAVHSVLTRPDPRDLNDMTSLTIRIDGVPPDEIVSVSCAGAEVKPVARAGAGVFDLGHAADRRVPEAYGRTDNPDNTAAPLANRTAFEGLQARLSRKEGRLELALRNAGAEALRDVRVTFRLPLRWQEGVVRREVGDLAGGADTTVAIGLAERGDADHYVDGKEYDVAQIDFRGAHQARLYAGCESADVEPAAYFARDGFLVMGPFPADSAGFDLGTRAKSFLAGQQPPAAGFETPKGGRLAWGVLEHAQAAILDPDIIPTTGTSNMTEYFNRTLPRGSAQPVDATRFLLWGRIVSPRAQTVRLVASHDAEREMTVNGQPVTGDQFDLRAGANEVRMWYAPAHAVPGLDRSFDITNYGCYFRLDDAEGRRVTDIRYERPLPVPGP